MSEALWTDTSPRSAAAQMAIDFAMVEIAKSIGSPLVRIYRWDESTLSLGANESACKTWDRQRLEADGVPCVRRPTGGRGVWHSNSDLTYAWAGPTSGPAESRQIYRILHERLGRAVASMGVTTSLAPAPTGGSNLGPGACFEHAVGGELLAGGRKLLGSAQRVFGNQLLQHGSFASQDHLRILDGYRLSPGPTARSSQKVAVPDATDISAAIGAAWFAEGAIEASNELTSRLEEASVQHHAKFGDPEWTWRR